MIRIIFIFALLFLIPQSISAKVIAKVTPKEGSALNYRIIGFSFPTEKGANNYEIEIAEGFYNSEDSFKLHVANRAWSNEPRIVMEVPSFGHAYTWRVVYKGEKRENIMGTLYHFSTLANPVVDTSLFRLEVTTNTGAHRDAYLFIDANKTLYDMNGNAVWFLPPIEGENIVSRDLKMTSYGTITFISDDKAYEINYNGDIVWKGPDAGQANGDESAHYHHEVTRLKNGHYMALGNERVLVKRGLSEDTDIHYFAYDRSVLDNNPGKYMPLMIGTVLEYDSSGHLLWSWKGSNYFSGSLARYFRNPNEYRRGAEPNLDHHQNAFYFDEKASNIYISYKNINTILKVKYPEGKVVNEYRGEYEPGAIVDNDLFCGQHCVGISHKGYLFTYNNNDCDPSTCPSIVMMEEPAAGGKLKKVWEYACPVNRPIADPRMGIRATAGGNVTELPDGTIFAVTSSDESRLFMVNMDKTILWAATIEEWNVAEKKWGNSHNSYRASIILNRKSLERLVWGEEMKNDVVE